MKKRPSVKVKVPTGKVELRVVSLMNAILWIPECRWDDVGTARYRWARYCQELLQEGVFRQESRGTLLRENRGGASRCCDTPAGKETDSETEAQDTNDFGALGEFRTLWRMMEHCL